MTRPDRKLTDDQVRKLTVIDWTGDAKKVEVPATTDEASPRAGSPLPTMWERVNRRYRRLA
jgi:hypothetical protein